MPPLAVHDMVAKDRVGVVVRAVIAIAAGGAAAHPVHTVFMVRYADLFFTQGENGIEFPGRDAENAELRYIDFAYLAFTIGMSYAVSDISLTSHKMRKAVLLHAGASYVFGAVIIAATVNLVVGLDFWHTSNAAKL